MQVCDWCLNECVGSEHSSFCSDDCKRRMDKFLLQTNCEWCYEPIQNRVGDKYCSLKCKENDLKYLKLKAKRKAVVPILSILGGAAVALSGYMTVTLSNLFRLSDYYYQESDTIFLGCLSWCFSALLLNNVAKQYVNIDRRLHSEGLRKYFGYPCMMVWIRANKKFEYYTRTYVTGYCCPGCKYKSIESQEDLVRQVWQSLTIVLLTMPIILLVISAVLKQLKVLTSTPNSYKFQDISYLIVELALIVFISMFIFIKIWIRLEDAHCVRHGMTYDEKNVLAEACEIIRSFARTLPTETQIQLKESVFSKSKSMLVDEAKSIVVSYYDNIKEKETLCRSMKDEFQRSVSFIVVNVLRKKSRDYELELKIVNQSNIKVVSCTISVNGSREYIDDMSPGETTVKIPNIKTSRVKISNPNLLRFIHEANGSQVEIHVDDILKSNYDNFLKLIGHERQIPT